MSSSLSSPSPAGPPPAAEYSQGLEEDVENANFSMTTSKVEPQITGFSSTDRKDHDDDDDDADADDADGSVKKKKKIPSSSFLAEGSCSVKQDLTWSEVNMTLKDRKGNVVKRILDDVWGSANAGETTAIMGASGAGKTSLFSILSGRIRSSRSIAIGAKIRMGGHHKIDPNQNMKIRTMFAFVAQEDSLHAPSTPRQALTFSAKLRLPKTTSDGDIRALVDSMIHELGLQSCADTIIGGGLQKGISGGEKRRTSIGIEMVSQPPIIFLDEPTSGLDSFAARQVMKLLQKVAKAGNTVLFTIHQPSSEVFSSFDRVILLNRGRLMFNDRTTAVATEFAKIGYAVPPNYNPADWILDVAQSRDVKELQSNGFFPRDPRPPMTDDAPVLVIPKDLQRRHVSLWTEFVMLMHREWISLVKNPSPMIINASLTAFLALIYGVIFWDVGNGDRSSLLIVQAQLGALVNILISTMMGQSQTALIIFSSERPLFLREYSTNHYSVVTYFVSHLVTEAIQSFVAVLVQALVVFWMIQLKQSFLQLVAVTFSLSMTSTAVSVLLGSIVSDSKIAASLFTLVVVPQFYFSGVFLATSIIPSFVRWAQYLCSLMYASRLTYIYEFTSCGGGEMAQSNCDAILERNGVHPDDEWWYWLSMIGLFTAFRLCAIVVLRQKGIDFS